MMEGVRSTEDELAEIDLTEDEVDSMMAAGERVEVVAPPGVDRRSVFIVYVDELNLYGWRLLSASGQVLANSRSYPTKVAALAAARAVIRASTDAALIDRTAS
jgi:uncharacterized protein YegP (UPF0339 family)